MIFGTHLALDNRRRSESPPLRGELAPVKVVRAQNLRTARRVNKNYRLLNILRNADVNKVVLTALARSAILGSSWALVDFPVCLLCYATVPCSLMQVPEEHCQLTSSDVSCCQLSIYNSSWLIWPLNICYISIENDLPSLVLYHSHR